MNSYYNTSSVSKLLNIEKRWLDDISHITQPFPLFESPTFHGSKAIWDLKKRKWKYTRPDSITLHSKTKHFTIRRCILLDPSGPRKSGRAEISWNFSGGMFEIVDIEHWRFCMLIEKLLASERGVGDFMIPLKHPMMKNGYPINSMIIHGNIATMIRSICKMRQAKRKTK